MGTLEKATREFRILNKYEKEEDRPIILDYEEEILALVKKFGESGQSGGSAPFTAYAISSAVKNLCLQKPIAPITGDDDEWNDVAIYGGDVEYQNNRCSAIFKKNKEAHYLDAIVFKGEDDWDTFTGTVEGIKSSQTIKEFPFTPKTFYIDVTREKVDVDPHTKEAKDSRSLVICGDGVYIYHIKDRTQLDEVFKVYKREGIE